MSEREPLVVVGTPRSGTTLFARFLNAHPDIACGPETQFFVKTTLEQRHAAVQDEFWPNKGVALIRQLTLSGEPVLKLFGLTEADIREYLSARTPSLRSLFEVLPRLFADGRNKRYIAEKTPNHLIHLEEIRSIFQKSPIIWVARDPRDSVRSMRKLNWASDSAIRNAYLWSNWFASGKKFFDEDDNCAVVRYEDLISDPERVLRDVCQSIKVEFAPEMLTTPGDAELAPPNEPWKFEATKAINSSRVAEWRNKDVELANAIMQICWEGIEFFSYPDCWPPTVSRRFAPLDAVDQFDDVLIEHARQRIAFQPTNDLYSENDLYWFRGLGLTNWLKAYSVKIARSFNQKKTTIVSANQSRREQVGEFRLDAD